MLRELSAHGPATGGYLLFIETTRYGRGFLVSVFDMGCCRPSREYGYLGACAFLFSKAPARLYGPAAECCVTAFCFFME